MRFLWAFLLLLLPRFSVVAAPSEPMSSTQKCFLALEVPAAATETLSVLQGELARKARDVVWTEPAGFHVTLRFLGEQPAAVIERLSEALSQVALGTKPIVLTARGLGTFPYRSRRSSKPVRGGPAAARVLWADVSGDRSGLKDLAAKIEAAVQAVGLPPPDYPFNPHLTLGRAKHRRAMGPLSEIIRDLKKTEFGPLEGASFTLFTVVREEPHGGYRVLQRFPLVGTPAE